MKITLPIYYTIVKKTKKNQTILVWMNWYRNAHFHISNKVKHYYHSLIAEEIGDVKFDKIKLKYKVYIKRSWTDYHNVRSILEKFFLDWLVENWNIIDDNEKYVLWDLGCEVFKDSENPRIEIEIIKENIKNSWLYKTIE